MNKSMSALFLMGILALPIAAMARPVTITTSMTNYRGSGAYMAIYLTDANGSYQQTLWVAGQHNRYYRNLRNWAQGSRLKSSEFDGLTGATVHSGKTMSIKVDLPDTAFDVGNQIRIDTAVEHGYAVPSEVSVPLDTANSGKTFKGRTYVNSLRFDL